MKIGMLGTGEVGQTLSTKLIELGHEVKMGSRTPTNAKAATWAKKAGAKASHGTFADAANFGEVVFNCTNGVHSLEALKLARADHLQGKVLIDVANALDMGKGGPRLLYANDDSLAERIQAAFPKTKVVKTLNTMWCGLMVNPRMLKDTHLVFLSGNDARAKEAVNKILLSFGWRDEEITDLGNLTTARGPEMLLLLWLPLWKAVGTEAFNFKLVR